ncbi:MAG: enoyl-CoA hydratase [Methyloligellaceae bacterium]
MTNVALDPLRLRHEGELLFEIDSGVGIVTFNRPEARNALTFAMYDGLAEICSGATRKDDLNVLMIRGAGGKAFAAGTDIGLFRDFRTAEDGLNYERKLVDVLTAVEACDVPTIALMSGACTGGGAAIAAVCDLRLATEDMRFGFPIARTLGNCLSAAFLVRLSALLGAGRTKDILLTSRLITAEEALAIGLVSEVLESEESLLRRARELAHSMATHAPLTIQITKEMFRRILAVQTEVDDDDLIALSYTSEDFREGVDAFLSKRPPLWKGR